MAYYDEVKEAADFVRARITTVPDLAIVLGSGLGDFAGTLGCVTNSFSLVATVPTGAKSRNGWYGRFLCNRGISTNVVDEYKTV